MLDLFGVEVPEKNTSRAPTGPAPESPERALPRRWTAAESAHWMRGKLAEIEHGDGGALTVADWLNLRWPVRTSEFPEPPETLRVLASKRAAVEQGDATGPLKRLFALPASWEEEIGRLARFYADSIQSEPAPSHVRAESFPSEWVRREVQRERIKDRARVLEPNGEQCFHSDDKVHKDRRLRAWISRRNQEVYTQKSAQRRCGKYRHGGRWETLPDGSKKRVRGGGGVELYARSTKFDAIPGKPDGRQLDGYRISLAGLVRCGSVWSCVCCAPRINSQRADLLHQIMDAHRATGGVVYMLTLTFPHSDTWTLKRSRDIKADAWRALQGHRDWGKIKRRMGYVGSVRATEITHGVNGWHPHLHILIATSRFLGDANGERERDALTWQIRCLWKWALEQNGVPASRLDTDAFEKHGVVFEVQRDASYIAKMGLADELTRGDAKGARGGNRTPFEIMRDYADYRTSADRATLRQYHRGIKGARQLEWSRGKRDLRKLYPPNAESTAQLALLDGEDGNTAALESADKAGVYVGEMGGGQWDALARVMHAIGKDAGTELQIYAEEFGPIHGQSVLLSKAHEVGLALATKRPKLGRWLFFLDPRRCEARHAP